MPGTPFTLQKGTRTAACVSSGLYILEDSEKAAARVVWIELSDERVNGDATEMCADEGLGRGKGVALVVSVRSMTLSLASVFALDLQPPSPQQGMSTN